MITPREVTDIVDAAILAGMNDCAAARAAGVTRRCARDRRKALAVPAFTKGYGGIHHGPPVTPDQFAKIDEAINAGHFDKVISRSLGVSVYQVAKRRALLGVPFYKPGDNGGSQCPPGHRPERKPRKPKQFVSSVNPAFRDPLYARVAEAVGRALPADIRDDAISDILVLVLSGELAEDQIEKRARKLSNKTIARWASRYGPPSLDESRGDSEDFNLYHLIASPEQRDAARIAELKMLAERMGIDADAVLDAEPEPCEHWTGKGTINRRRRSYVPYTPRRPHAEPEYSLVGELSRPSYGSGKWLGYSPQGERTASA